ncbi:MAG: DUF4468 domain-containing protein [Prevotellaceae bacterium]|jgi:hypothetical protein|nr:DUF4468 domain-containing protein [Prevotellaceae bacterium]
MTKKVTQILFVLMCSLSLSVQAQSLSAHLADSKYLAGAVPLKEGRVLFSHVFSMPGMSKEQVYDYALAWMTFRLQQNANDSRVVYTDSVKGEIVGLGNEYLTFSSTALSLDRADMHYHLMAYCQKEQCTIEVSRIYYLYPRADGRTVDGSNKERLPAEELITDEMALNKTQDRVLRGLAKWRIYTVDYIDDLYVNAAQTMSSGRRLTVQSGVPVIQPVTAPVQRSNITVVTVPSAVPAASPAPSAPAVAAAPVAPAPSAPATATLHQVSPANLPADAIRMGEGKLVVVIGTDVFNMTTMVVGGGGSLGKMGDKSVIYTILTPDQPYQSLESADVYTVRFYPTGQTEPSVELRCKKLSATAPGEGQPRIYVGEIQQAFIKQ